MRAFYVGVTRAQRAVVLVGGRLRPALPPMSDRYSWQDEALKAERFLNPEYARYSDLTRG
jgi:hypothetical protein